MRRPSASTRRAEPGTGSDAAGPPPEKEPLGNHRLQAPRTPSLFVALEVASGKGEMYRKLRHQEVLKFLREVEKAVLKKQEISRILNNYAPGHGLDRAIEADLPTLPPTSASWQNRVERCLRDYIQTCNEPPAPSLDKAADEILEKANRARQALAATSV